jgi:hypothetical protein
MTSSVDLKSPIPAARWPFFSSSNTRAEFMKASVTYLLIAFLFIAGLLQASVAHGEEFDSFELNVPVQEVQLALGQQRWDELSPLYGEILNELGMHYQGIGERQAREVLNRQNGFYLGGYNNVGFHYARRFSTFDVNVERQLAPDLFDDHRWIVTDQVHITIDASRLMGKLRDDGLVSLSESQHALFAGIQFRRTYRYVHFADSYQEGLTLNMNKLFMSFQKLRRSGIVDLDPYEIIQRDDYLSASVGALAMVPITTGVGMSVGALGKLHHLAKLEVQSVGPEDQAFEGERVRVSYEKTRGALVGVSVGVHAEFLRFLRLTLLSYDFHYSIEQSQRTYLSFDEGALASLDGDSALSEALSNVLRGRLNADLYALAPYIVSHEQRQLERRNSKYMVLIFGGHKEQRTEYIEFVKDGLQTIFFRHNFERLRYVENIWSRLIAALLRSSLQLNALVNHEQSDSKKMRMEYQAGKNLLDLRGDLSLEPGRTHQLSLNFEREYQAQNARSRAMKDLSRLLGTFSGVDPLISDMVDRGEVAGPMRLRARTVVTEEGVYHLNALNADQALDYINGLCGVKPTNIFQWFRSLFNGCRHRLTQQYDWYWKELHHRMITSRDYEACQSRVKWYWTARKKQAMLQMCMEMLSYREGELREIPLWRLRDFGQTLFDESDNKIDLFHFFGLSNVYLHGSFEAQTNNGPFLTHFQEGRFRSLGAVDGLMRETHLRAPASVIVD